jgi:hypothetical protein
MTVEQHCLKRLLVQAMLMLSMNWRSASALRLFICSIGSFFGYVLLFFFLVFSVSSDARF